MQILGAEYELKVVKSSEDKMLRSFSLMGYCDCTEKLICIADVNDVERFGDLSKAAKKRIYNETVRHEILHAYFNESGLSESTSSNVPWAINEEMIDWFAIQSPKIYATYKEVGVL